ncbi:28S ribosomal protein S18b [Schistosoma japonicum]|nr:28S ribosomal protein S18b [Schistosoma japonicum]
MNVVRCRQQLVLMPRPLSDGTTKHIVQNQLENSISSISDAGACTYFSSGKLESTDIFIYLSIKYANFEEVEVNLTTHNAQIRPVFGINICPPFLHYCAKSELAKKATKAKRDNAVEEITIRENYKYKPYKQADLATSIEYFNSDGICRRQEKILQQEVEKARDLGYIQIWLPFYLYNYNDYYDYLPKDQLNELLKINNQFMQNNVGVISSSDITCLPPDIQEILKTNQSIPHAVEFDVHLPKIDIHPPKIRLLSNSKSHFKEHNLYQCGRFLWTSANEGHGSLNYIAPQTRLRVVDNSPWSSIAPSTRATTVNTGGKDQSGKKLSNINENKLSKLGKDVNDVSNLLTLGSKVLSIKPAKCIRVYNKRDRGKIGMLRITYFLFIFVPE